MQNRSKKVAARLLKFLMIIALASCSATKSIPPGDALYTGASVQIEDNKVAGSEKKTLQTDLKGMTRPKPNSKIFGIPFKLFMYNLGSDSSAIGRFIRKFGEPPVLLSSVNLERNAQLLTNNLENKGFFKAVTHPDTTVSGKKASASYKITTNDQYKISSVTFVRDSSQALQNAIAATESKTLLTKDQPFNLDLIKAERLRIDAVLKEQGFYYFSPDNIEILIDSTIGDSKVNLYVSVKPNTSQEARTPYTINKIFIYANYRLNTAATDTTRRAATEYKGYSIIDRRNMFKPRLFEQTMQFKPGELYNRKDHNLALNRLISLGVFKFVKNRFEPVKDSAKLDGFYYLTPLPKKSLRFEAGANTKSNNMTGSQVSLSWKNRNTFREAELLTVSITGGFEMQYSGQFRGYNTYRLGADAEFSIPRFVIPWIKLNTTDAYVPRTIIQLGYEALTRLKLYTLNSFHSNMGYAWKPRARKEHILYPIALNYVQPFNVTKIYTDSAKNNITLRNAIDTQFIIGSNYTYTYDDRIETNRRTGMYFNGLIDLSGNLAGLLIGKNETGVKEIFGAKFSQYLKAQLDGRYYFNVIKNKTILANRAIFGYGYPYGNSRTLPFIKQFFIGGSNSLRGFRSRSLGPGRYKDTLRKTGFLADQSGDIKLELNTELRHRFNNIVEGALFVDAGNVWLYNDDPARPGGKFTGTFLKELAVDAGVGLRLDFQILLLRLDVGIPIRKPWLSEGNGWVLRDIDISNKDWRGQNMILNLGIGYPF